MYTDVKIKRCITAIGHDTKQTSDYKVSLRKCNTTDPFQQWNFGKYTEQYEDLVNTGTVPKDVFSNVLEKSYYDNYKMFLTKS